MEIIYKWQIQDCKLDLTIDVSKVKWLYSKVKDKEYFKSIIKKWSTKYEIIWFKWGYIIIWQTVKAIKKEWDLEFPNGRYKRRGI